VHLSGSPKVHLENLQIREIRRPAGEIEIATDLGAAVTKPCWNVERSGSVIKSPPS
jgi:hypothetical protein